MSELKLYSIKFCTLFVTIGYLVIPIPVFSQRRSPPPNLDRKTLDRMQAARNAQKRDENIRQLKEPVELPQLPSYPGKPKFVRGYTQTSEKGYVVYQLNFLTKEGMQEVKNWYQNTLNMYRWRMQHAGRQNLVALNKDGSLCTVIVNPTVEPGYHCELNIYYTQAPTKQ